MRALASVSGSVRVVTVNASLPLTRGRPAEFRQRGLALVPRTDATSALKAVAQEPSSIVLVPTRMPDMHLFDFLEIVSSISGARVLVGIEADEDVGLGAQALDRGAAGLIGVPASPMQLAQAVQAVPVARPERPTRYECGGLVLDLVAHRLFWNGIEVHLPPREFDMLTYLMAEHPRLIGIDELVSEFGGGGGSDAHERIRHILSRLRNRLLESSPGEEPPIENLRGVGYRLMS